MKTRILSALAAVSLVAAITYIWKEQGLYVVCLIASLGCIYEYSRLTFQRENALFHIQASYIALSAAVFFVTSAGAENLILLVTAGASVLLMAMILMTVRQADDLSHALKLQSFGILGFLYCGIFPGLAVRTLFFEGGMTWLFSLLVIVFSSDTCAYLTGRALGRRKLLEAVSPKKTIEGSIGGLLGAGIAGIVLGTLFFPDTPILLMAALGLVTGGFSQVGDLFESLIKRVADVKDSGSIMPGHGGFLDRLDGVLFAAPVFYILTRFLI